MNYSDENAATHQAAMKRPIPRPMFEPSYDLDGPHRARRKRNRRYFFLTLAVIGGLVIARLVLRFLFGVQ